MAEIQSSILERQAVLIQLSAGRWSAKRKVGSLAGIDTDADKDRLHLAADLLKSSELDAVATFDAVTRAWVMARALPVSLFAAGVYVLPVASVTEVDEYLTRRFFVRERLVSDFLDIYEDRSRLGRLALGSLADVSRYPSVASVDRQFRMSWGFFSLGAPASLEGVQSEIFARERDRIAGEFAGALSEARDALREIVSGMVDHLLDRLTPDPSGKAKRFEGTTVSKLSEFCDLFQARNLADDADLAAEVAKIRAMLSGVRADDLRGSAFARRDVSTRLSEVKLALDGLLVDAPRRLFSFDKSGDPGLFSAVA